VPFEEKFAVLRAKLQAQFEDEALIKKTVKKLTGIA